MGQSRDSIQLANQMTKLNWSNKWLDSIDQSNDLFQRANIKDLMQLANQHILIA